MNIQYFIFILFMLSSTLLPAQTAEVKIKWKTLSPIPDTMGFAGAYITATDDFLLVMGGANFPDGIAPWDGGKKVWTNKIFALKDKQGNWISLGHLPIPMGYGAVTSFQNDVFVAGGSNEDGHLSSVYKLTWKENRWQIENLPSLPFQLANCSSVRIGSLWYIVGGIKLPDSPTAESICWRMDLTKIDKGWEICPPIPGEGRMLSVVADGGGSLVVLSGVSLKDGKRKYLQDAYILDDHTRWSRIVDLPESVAAAPSPAWYDRKSNKLFVFGGDNGELANQDLKHDHPGFSNRILTYNFEEALWHYNVDKIIISEKQQHGKTWVPVTTGTANWAGGIVLPSGEIRPGIRTPQVLWGTIKLD
ncbi:galactose oxidase [Sphingobacterium olei]|nr:galactose oxidase [Sphingobacterium olei]